MTSEHFSMSWDNFHKNMSSGMNSLFENEDLVDVTLAVEGRYLKAHKMVLSVCSPYFRELFKTSPCTHPIVFMKDVSYVAMNGLLQFMYHGEVQVCQENFTTFLKTAESLQIKGLSNYDNGLPACTTENSQDKTNPIQVSQSLNLNSEKTHHRSPSPPSKRPRLSEETQPAIVKTESEVATTSDFFEEQSIHMKMEPYDQEQISSGNLSDDQLDENFADETNEDYWIIEDDDEESPPGTSEDVVLVGEESIPSDMEESAVSFVLPEKSKDTYKNAFNRFEQWCSENNAKSINEDVLMSYFKEKSLTCKSSSLLSTYSMLRTMILIKKEMDIKKYKNLFTLLKSQSKGYQTKRSKVFKREDFERFLRYADNDTYLLMKVAMIFGIIGACTNSELSNLLTTNVIDEGNFIKINLPDNKLKTRKFILTAGNIENVNVIEIVRKYMNLRVDNRRFFVCYRHGHCTNQPVGVNTFGAMPKHIAQFLGLKNAEQYTGYCFRRTSAFLKL